MYRNSKSQTIKTKNLILFGTMLDGSTKNPWFPHKT